MMRLYDVEQNKGGELIDSGKTDELKENLDKMKDKFSKLHFGS